MSRRSPRRQAEHPHLAPNGYDAGMGTDPTTADLASYEEQVRTALLSPTFRRATFGGVPRSGPAPWVRVVVRAVEVRGQRCLQFSYFDGRKDVSRNYPVAAAAAAALEAVLAVHFSAVHITTATEDVDVRLTRKGRVCVGRHRREKETAIEPHNRTKDLPLPEGRANRLLEIMGIATTDGRVRPSMRAKFTQINEFLKQLCHAWDEAGLNALGRPVDILDCGCGSSYLTLAAHHYLNEVLGVPARILGVDVNDEVIRKSMTKAAQLGAASVNFACQRIDRVDTAADIVLALHACDTATDDAIALAIRCRAKLLLCVPCCHKDLNRQLRARGSAEVLRPLLRHGILRQRTADLVTDAFRALSLRVMGYRTEVVEFVGTEHTARNVMLRAIAGLPPGDPAAVSEYQALKRFWGVTPYIEKALGEPFLTRLRPDPADQIGHVPNSPARPNSSEHVRRDEPKNSAPR